MSIHTILSQEVVPDKTNRIYVRTKKYPNGGLIMGEEVDTFLKHLATRIVEESGKEVTNQVKLFIKDQNEHEVSKEYTLELMPSLLEHIFDNLFGTKLQKMKGGV